LLPGVALAEPFTLPGQTQLVYEMYYYGYNGNCGYGGPQPLWGEICKGETYYDVTPHIYYRVLVDGNGKETVLDSYKTWGTKTYSRMNDIEGHNYYWFDLPLLNVSIDEPGTYRVELRRIDINRPTDNNNPNANLGSIIDSWGVTRGSTTGPDAISGCTNTYYNQCYIEHLDKKSVPIESLAQTLEVTEINVAGNPGGAPAEGSAISGAATSNPFTDNQGTHTANPDVPDNPLIPMLFAGAIVTSAVVLASGSRIKTWLTQEGQAAASAKANAYAQIEADKIAEAKWYAELQTQKSKTAMKEKLKATYAAALSAGPTAAMVASVPFVGQEETVSRGVFNFLDALNLKDQYDYTMAEALAVAYRKNKLVNAVNDLSGTIEETQDARINVADKYPWPISSCVKISASYAKESGLALTSLVGNGFFAAGATVALLYDSVTHPNDAMDNLSAMFDVAMGSLFRSTYYVGSTIKNKDPEVSAGLIASYVIAPEDAVFEREGKLARAGGSVESGAAKMGEKAAERSVEKSVEKGEVHSMAELLGGETVSASKTGGQWGKTFIEASNTNNNG